MGLIFVNCADDDTTSLSRACAMPGLNDDVDIDAGSDGDEDAATT